MNPANTETTTPTPLTNPPYIQTPYGKLTLCSLSMGYENTYTTNGDIEVSFDIYDMSDDFCKESLQRINELMPEKYLEEKERYIAHGIKDVNDIVIKRIEAFIGIWAYADGRFITELTVMGLDESESLEVNYSEPIDITPYIDDMKQMVFSLIEQRYFSKCA